MYYVIYPDTLFLENLICNVCFLLVMKFLYFPDAGGRRILLAGSLTALCNTLASILFFHCSWILKTGILLPAAGLMICECMEIQERKKILYLLYQITLWTLVFGGIFQGILQWKKTMSAVTIAAAAFLILLLCAAAEKLFTYYKRQNECMREIVLSFHGKNCHVHAFADTGNQLYDPCSKKPVSIADAEVWEKLMEQTEEPLIYPIPYQSIGSTGSSLQAMCIDYMVIRQGKNSRVIKNPVIAMTSEPFKGIFHYSVLLHNEYC